MLGLATDIVVPVLTPIKKLRSPLPDTGVNTGDN